MHEVAQKFMNTLLFSFQDLKLSTKGKIIVLKDSLNITVGPLPIPDPHATGVPSNTLEKHSISSRVVHGIRNLVISSSMVKLMALLLLILHSHIRKKLRTLHLWICYLAKALWITILSTKSLIHF
jgi:hypothetical protein